MKKIKFYTLLALLLLMGGVTMQAQEYDPLVAEGKRWNVMLSDCWFPPEPQKHTTTSYKMEGDTVFEGLTYNKVYATKYDELIRWEFIGLIRENDKSKQVFIEVGEMNSLEMKGLCMTFHYSQAIPFQFGTMNPITCIYKVSTTQF